MGLEGAYESLQVTGFLGCSVLWTLAFSSEKWAHNTIPASQDLWGSGVKSRTWKTFSAWTWSPWDPSSFFIHCLFNKYWLTFLTQKLFPCSPFA